MAAEAKADRFKVTGTCRWTDSEKRVLPGGTRDLARSLQRAHRLEDSGDRHCSVIPWHQ